MIERNLGNIERLLRLVMGILVAGWLSTRVDMNGIEWFVAIVSLFLILNGVFGRCYLWFVLNINSREQACTAPACLREKRTA